MTKEELIGKLKMVYVGDKNALNELIGYYDGLKECIEVVQQENEQLKANWDKLNEWLKNNWIESQDIWFVKIINKMQEIEGSDIE